MSSGEGASQNNGDEPIETCHQLLKSRDMSSGKGASQNNGDRPIETCHQLLKSRDFLAARFLAHMNNQIVSNKRYDIFEQARAICDVLIAAENHLPNGFMDCYGMIRVNRLGPVILEDYEKLMKLLDKKHNPFPFCEEAAEKASLAWSLLSVPLHKAYYDLTIAPYSQSGEGRVENGKRKMEYPHRFPDYVINADPTTDDGEMVVTSDDDGREGITMARTAKLCKINGKSVKVIPVKLKRKY